MHEYTRRTLDSLGPPLIVYLALIVDGKRMEISAVLALGLFWWFCFRVHVTCVRQIKKGWIQIRIGGARNEK